MKERHKLEIRHWRDVVCVVVKAMNDASEDDEGSFA